MVVKDRVDGKDHIEGGIFSRCVLGNAVDHLCHR